MGTHPIFESDFDCLTDMEEVHQLGNGVRLLIQLIPETGENNFQYLIYNENEKTIITIDCFNPDRVLERVGDNRVVASLATHHHWDHVGGIKKLKESFPHMEIIGGDARVEGITNNIETDCDVEISKIKFRVLRTPCHTTGSVCYFLPEHSIVFTGDTIFCGGVGRFFEGDANDMVAAVKKIKDLGPETRIFPGHEYSVSNLKFAKYYDDNNKAIESELHNFVKLRSDDKFTIPSTVKFENQINPFFRYDQPELIKKSGGTTEVEVMKLIRESKNSFRPK